MRTRQLMTMTLVAVGLVLGVTSFASAQTTTTKEAKGETSTTVGITPISAVANEGTTETKSEGSTVVVANLSHENAEIYECFEKEVAREEAKAGTGEFTSCAKAPSPILPAQNELIWGTLSFLVLLLAFIWKGYPALKKGMDGRADRIREDLARADEAKAEAEAVLAQYQQQVAASKGEATRIIEDARATADATKAEMHRRAEAEIAEMKLRAAADIEAAKVQAISDLKGEVATLAIGAAEAVVQKALDPSTQVQLIENYINQVGARSTN